MKYSRLIISLALPQFAGLIGSFFTVSAIPIWYASLQKPSFNPPNWIFGPVWLLLYVMMGVSIYLIWSSPRINEIKVNRAFRLFWAHLFVNAIWSIIFFGLKNTGLAFLNIIIMWLMIIILMLKFWGINKWSTYLLVPYWLWVSFASVLNYFIWTLN